MSIFEQLLEVQNHDTSIAQLQHRRVTLPERASLADAASRLAANASSQEELAAERTEMALRQRRLEGDVAAIEAKVTETDAKLYGGNVTALKELQALQDEIAGLQRRQGDLEDEIIALMEGAEVLDRREADLADAAAAIGAEIDRLDRELAAAEQAIDAELASEGEARQAVVAGLPTELVGEYERLRDQLDGIAVAELRSGQCLGCHLGLSAVEVDRIKREPADAVVHCGECGRILVR